jgi:photosystem II stability/assembly factor-like uncharacterized protein
LCTTPKGRGLFSRNAIGFSQEPVHAAQNDLKNQPEVLPVKCKAILLACLGVLLVVPAKSWTQWVQTSGPGGGYAGAFLSVGSSMLVSTSNGVYITKDNGAHWTAADTGLHASCFLANGTDILAGAYTGAYHHGLFLSSDTGIHWTATNSGLSNLIITALASSGNSLFAGTNEGVFVSGDNGAHWSPVANGLPQRSVSSIGEKGTDLFIGYNDYLYNTVPDTGLVYRSTDNGQHWTRADTGIVDSNFAVSKVNSLYASGADLFAGTDCGVFRSVNNGIRWTAVNNGLPSTSNSRPFVNSLTSAGSYLFAGTDYGVFRSANNGASWTALDSGSWTRPTIALATAGKNIFAGTWASGVFLSTDNGATWNPVNQGMPNIPVKSFAVSGTNLFAGTESGGVFRSNNKGAVWTPENFGLPKVPVRSFAVSGTNLFAAAYPAGLYRSSNSGASWTRVTDVGNYGISAIGLSGNTLFAGDGSIYRSTNNGLTWDTTTSPPLFCEDSPVDFSCIAGNGRVVLGGFGWCFVTRSTNNGGSWVNTNTDYKAPIPRLVNAFTWIGETVFAGAVNGAYYSTDTGTHWTAVTALPDSVNALAVIGTDLLAGTGRGVFLSSDNGLNWAAENTGFTTNTTVYTLVEADSDLYVGTNSGVWRRPLSDFRTNVHEKSRAMQNTFNLHIGRNNSVHYDIPASAFVSIKLFDVKGRMVLSLVNKKQEIGSYLVKIPAGLSQGWYVLSASVGDAQTDREIMVLR